MSGTRSVGLIAPVLMNNPTPHEDSLDDEKGANGEDEDQRNQILIRIFTLICLWEDVNHRVSNHGSAS